MNHSKIFRINGNFKEDKERLKDNERGMLDKRFKSNLDKKRSSGEISKDSYREIARKKEDKRING